MWKTLYRFIIGSAVIGALVGQALAAGTIPVVLVQQLDGNGSPLRNCQLFLYQVGTVATPQTAYQDTALSLPLPWPVECDANGRVPMFYLADGSVHPLLKDSTGLVQFDYPSMLVIGPSSGGGGGSTVDPTAILSTGDVKFRPTSEVLAGFVKMNGQTIGSATSGASGRANADTLNLFTYLWQNCTNAHCPVLTGRGVSASADFAANKQITLPDWRARIPVGLDDMGSTAAGILPASTVSGGDTPTTPGAIGGSPTHTLLAAELPVNGYQSAVSDPGNRNLWSGAGGTPSIITDNAGGNLGSLGLGGGGGFRSPIAAYPMDTALTGVSVSTTVPTGGAAHNVMNTFQLGTWYCKL